MPGVKRLSGALMVRMTPVMVADIEAVAIRAELPVSEVVRLSIERGLPGLKQSLRPSRRAKRSTSRPGGAK